MNYNIKKLIVTLTLLILTIGVTFAYLAARTGEGKQAGTTITADTVDDLKFNVSKENLSLNINQFNFASGAGNLTDNVTATASLKANSTKSTATYNYYVYFQIESNDYVYTTTDKKPEIVLSITGPNGEITSVDGLTYVSATNADGTVVKGFDITTLGKSITKIANSYEISSSSSTNYTNQEWTFTVTFINLDTNQVDNQNKSLTAKVMIQKDEFKQSLSEYIISQYTGTQGENGLYYHNGTIKDKNYNILDAEDNSYRYYGLNPNNYICFGSEEVTCPEDNLYRIIGVFGDNNHGVTGKQLVKVIKNTSYGKYAWNTTSSNDWKTSSLNTILNTTFITEKLSGYEEKIETVNWKIEGSNNFYVTAKTFYNNEIKSATKIYQAKIGLLYLSDFAYASIYSQWQLRITDYYDDTRGDNWLYQSDLAQWTLSPDTSNSNNVCFITSSAYAFGAFCDDTIIQYIAVKPSFYISSDLIYKSGMGSFDNPIRISL